MRRINPPSARRLGAYGTDDPDTYPGGQTPTMGPYSERAIFNGRAGSADSTTGYAAEATAVAVVPQPNNIKFITIPFVGKAVSYQVLTQNTNRRCLIIQNLDSAVNLYVGFGTAAVVSSSLLLLPTVAVLFDTITPGDSIDIIFTGGAASRGIVIEGSYTS